MSASASETPAAQRRRLASNLLRATLKQLIYEFGLKGHLHGGAWRGNNKPEFINVLETHWPARLPFPLNETQAWDAIHAERQRQQQQQQAQFRAWIPRMTSTFPFPPTLASGAGAGASAFPMPENSRAAAAGAGAAASGAPATQAEQLTQSMDRASLAAGPADGSGADTGATVTIPDAATSAAPTVRQPVAVSRPQLVFFDLDETLFHTSKHLRMCDPFGRRHLTQTVFIVNESTITVVQFFDGPQLLRTVLISEITLNGVCAKFEIRLRASEPENDPGMLGLVIVRPGALQVVQRVMELPHTRVGIWTARRRDYASALIAVMRAHGVIGQLRMVLTREQCLEGPPGVYRKPLSRVFNNRSEIGLIERWNSTNTLLVDNRPEVSDQYPFNVRPVDDFQLAPCEDMQADATLRLDVARLACLSGNRRMADAILAGDGAVLLRVDALEQFASQHGFIADLVAHLNSLLLTPPAYECPDWPDNQQQ
jgi:hypothetical protein